MSPAQFIPIAEETGIIVEMGKWIIKTVLMKFKELQMKCYITPMVSINISVVQIRIALDDFGTGYASLSYLQMLPINVLKIDKPFIDKISSQSIKNQIVGNFISLSHQLDIEVVAEGVELEEQLEYLMKHNCDYV